MAEMTGARTGRLADNLRRVVEGTEDLIENVRREGSDRYRDVVDTIERDIERARSDLETLERKVARQARASWRRVDRLAHRHPWEAVGIAVAVTAAVAAVIGVLVGMSLQSRD